jgi:signal transduction histidine kinase/CHASE3 domain sensor protein
MEESDSSCWRRLKEALMHLWEPFAVKSLLKRLCKATSVRLQWLALGLLVTVGLSSFWSTSTLIETTNSRKQLRTMIMELQGAFFTVDDAESGQLGYLLVGDESYLEPFQQGAKVIDEQFDRVEELMNALPGQRSNFDAMRRLTAMKFAYMKTTIQLRQTEGIESAMDVIRTHRGKEIMDEIRAVFIPIKDEAQKLLLTYGQDSVALSTRVTWWGIFGNVLAAALFVSVIRRDLRDRKRLAEQATELARNVETSRLQATKQSEDEIESLGQQARVLADFVQTLQEQTLTASDKEIAALGLKARELARSVEASRMLTLNESDKEIEALAKKARELAAVVETSRLQTLRQSDGKIEALGKQARDLATSVESSRLQTFKRSDMEIKALAKKARDLASSMESSRIQTLSRSDNEIRTLNEELDQRVLQHMAQLEASNKELEAFSYSVSHDLRAPLRAIDGFSRIVLEDYSAPLAPEGKAYLQMVRDNTRQMGQLVDDLLAFSRLGRQPLTKHAADPKKIVRRCLEEMTTELQGRHVDIAVGNLPPCNADPTLLKQVWTNLISNALKYTRKRENACIEIGCYTAPRLAADEHASSPKDAAPEVVYFVKDNGTGFDMKYVGKLFGVFQRLHRAPEYEGTGVGLAIVQRIVQRHRGRIWADSIVNQGATFSFTLE